MPHHLKSYIIMLIRQFYTNKVHFKSVYASTIVHPCSLHANKASVMGYYLLSRLKLMKTPNYANQLISMLMRCGPPQLRCQPLFTSCKMCHPSCIALSFCVITCGNRLKYANQATFMLIRQFLCKLGACQVCGIHSPSSTHAHCVKIKHLPWVIIYIQGYN